MAGETNTAATTAATAAATTTRNAAGERAAPSTSLSHSIDKLDRMMATGKSNYNSWRFRLVLILKEKDLLTVVTESPLQATPAAGEGTAASGASATTAGKVPSVSPELAVLESGVIATFGSGDEEEY